MSSEKYIGQRPAPAKSGVPMGVWVAIAVVVLVGVILYFVYDRSFTSVVTSPASSAAPSATAPSAPANP